MTNQTAQLKIAQVRGAGTLALVVFGTLGMAMLTLMPTLLGALTDELGVTAARAGMIASLQLCGAAFGGAVVLLTGHLINGGKFVSFGAAVMATALLACAFARDINQIGLLWAVAGLGGGAMSTAVVRLAAFHPQPARAYALILIGQMGFGFLGFLALPHILARYGLPAPMFLLSVLTLASLPLALCLHQDQGRTAGAANPLAALNAPVILVALSLLAHYVANTMLWTYADRIGVFRGASSGMVSVALAGSMVTGLVGALMAGAWGRRFSAGRGVFVGVALIFAATALLLLPSAGLYVLSVFGMNLAIMFVFPLYLGFLAETEGGEDAAALGSLVVCIGLMAGPALGAALIRAADFRPMILAALALFLCAFLLAVAGVRAQRLRRAS